MFGKLTARVKVWTIVSILLVLPILTFSNWVDIMIEWRIDELGRLSSTLYLTPNILLLFDGPSIVLYSLYGLLPFAQDIEVSSPEGVTMAVACKKSIYISSLNQSRISFDGINFKFYQTPLIDNFTSNLQEVFATLKVVFPRPVLSANSTEIYGNTVIWRITRNMINNGYVLTATLKRSGW